MYDGYSQTENKIEIRFSGAGGQFFPTESVFEGERLPFELFLTVREGEMTLALKKTETVIEAGAVALVPYDSVFRAVAKAGTKRVWVAADYRVFTNLRVFSLFDMPCRVDGKTNDPASIMDRIYQTVLDNEFTNTRLENALEINAALYQLALIVLRRSMPKSDGGTRMNRFEKLAPVLSHIGEHLDKSCPIGELSELLGMSEDSFYRFFKTTIGKAPKDYLISERLRRARGLLIGTNLSVTEISKLCGYDNPFYFSTLFHGKYGSSPTAYREKTAAIVKNQII